MAKKKSTALDEFKSSMEKVWLAGLGALAQAEKQGDKLFKSLVKKGKKYEDLVPRAEEAVKDSVKAARKQAGETFSGMEDAFDKQVKAAMQRAGLASQKEVDALKKEVAMLKKRTAASGSTGRKKSSKKKTTAKKKTKKKPATKKRAKR